MSPTPSEIEQVTDLLANNLQRIIQASAGVDDARLHWRPDAKSWSANDILAHVRACTDVWGKSVHRILTEENGSQTHISPRTWMRKTNYLDLDYHVSLQTFVQQRQDFLELLEPLTPTDWARSASVNGRKEPITVFGRVQGMALHESEHCTQLEMLLT